MKKQTKPTPPTSSNVPIRGGPNTTALDPREVEGAEPGLGPILVIGLEDLREPIVIKRSTWKGQSRVSIRAHYWKKATGVLNPGRRGIEIPLNLLGEVIEALQQTQEGLEKTRKGEAR